MELEYYKLLLTNTSYIIKDLAKLHSGAAHFLLHRVASLLHRTSVTRNYFSTLQHSCVIYYIVYPIVPLYTYNWPPNIMGLLCPCTIIKDDDRGYGDISQRVPLTNYYSNGR